MTFNYTVTTDDFGSIAAVESQKVLSPGNVTRDYSVPSNGGYTDYFKRQRSPDNLQEVNAFKRYAYACAMMNAQQFAQHQPKLYVKTNATQRKPRLPTKELSTGQVDYLCSLQSLDGFTKDFAKIEEVVEHPLLKLLRKVNNSFFLNSYTLPLFTQLYQEITGEAYWFIEYNDLTQQPDQLWILPSQYVFPRQHPGKTRSKTNPVDYYEYTGGQQTEQIPPHQIMAFLMPSLTNPYLTGKSPLEASWEDELVSDKLISHQSGILDNEVRPDALITPKEPIDPDEAKAWERKFNLKFARGKSGGVAVLHEDVNFFPISWKPSDLAQLEIHKWSKLSIANAFQTPIALLESQSINRATLEAAQMQHGRYCIRPRQEASSANINNRIIPLYDESERLFLAYENPVPEDEDLKVKKHVGLVQAGIETANEARKEYNLPPHKDGDKLESANAIASEEREKKRQDGSADK